MNDLRIPPYPSFAKTDCNGSTFPPMPFRSPCRPFPGLRDGQEIGLREFYPLIILQFPCIIK